MIRDMFDTYRCRRTLASLVAGLTLGIWGITGWVGFLYYFGIHVVVGIILNLACMTPGAKCSGIAAFRFEVQPIRVWLLP